MIDKNNPCFGCRGQCCIHPICYPRWITESDIEREPKIKKYAIKWEGETPPDGKQYYNLGKPGACPMLIPEGMCSIYETRPNLCRLFSAGSTQCNSVRQNVGLPIIEMDRSK